MVNDQHDVVEHCNKLWNHDIRHIKGSLLKIKVEILVEKAYQNHEIDDKMGRSKELNKK